MSAVNEAAGRLGTKCACAAVGLSRAGYYRLKRAARAEEACTPAAEQDGANVGIPNSSRPCAVPGRALTNAEEQSVIDQLHSDRFVDLAPPQVYSALLDEGEYLCSISTMYRILRKHGEVKERRAQRRHPVYAKPELLATKPNQVWSWDITKLKGPHKWSYYYLYVIMDIYSRNVVGWMVAERESADLAHDLIAQTLINQGITPGQLVLHADRGSSMKSNSVAMLLESLGVVKTHSRPHTSNDNPFSESQFRTLKYRPQFPERFSSLQEAREVCRELLNWYNTQHYHSGIGLLTPEAVHYGKGQAILEQRAEHLRAAYTKHPSRFVNKPPIPFELPKAVYINPPAIPKTIPADESEASRDDCPDEQGHTNRRSAN